MPYFEPAISDRHSRASESATLTYFASTATRPFIEAPTSTAAVAKHSFGWVPCLWPSPWEFLPVSPLAETVIVGPLAPVSLGALHRSLGSHDWVASSRAPHGPQHSNPCLIFQPFYLSV